MECGPALEAGAEREGLPPGAVFEDDLHGAGQGGFGQGKGDGDGRLHDAPGDGRGEGWRLRDRIEDGRPQVHGEDRWLRVARDRERGRELAGLARIESDVETGLETAVNGRPELRSIGEAFGVWAGDRQRGRACDDQIGVAGVGHCHGCLHPLVECHSSKIERAARDEGLGRAALGRRVQEIAEGERRHRGLGFESADVASVASRGGRVIGILEGPQEAALVRGHLRHGPALVDRRAGGEQRDGRRGTAIGRQSLRIEPGVHADLVARDDAGDRGARGVPEQIVSIAGHGPEDVRRSGSRISGHDRVSQPHGDIGRSVNAAADATR